MSVSMYKLTGVASLYFTSAASGAKAINAPVWFFLNRRTYAAGLYHGGVLCDTPSPIAAPGIIAIGDLHAETVNSASDPGFTSLLSCDTFREIGDNAHVVYSAPSTVTVYTRAFTAGHGGTVDVGTGIDYSIGTCAATPTESANHEFVEWRNVSDDSAVVPVTGLTIDATTHKITISASYTQDVDVYAYFRSTTVALNCSESGNGTLGLRVDGVLQSAITGLTFDRDVIHTIRLTNTADYGYKFYWYGITPSQDGVASATTYVTSEDYTFYTETDGPDLYTVVAYFVVRPTAHLDAAKVNPTYGTIKLTLSDATVINESANVISEDVYEGYEHTLLATVSDPATNYFVGWFTESAATNLVSAAASYAFTPDSEDVTNGITLYAVFREKADISVTTEIQLDDIPEASEFDGNVFETYTSAPLKAGDVQFTLSANTSHYWGNPDITVSEITKGGSSAFNSVTYHAADDDYTIDENGRVTLSLAPLQTWTEGEDPIAYTVSANFSSESVGETVIRGANAGTYAWMYPYQFTNWKDRNNATPPDPGRPENPHYGDTGTLTISPIDSAKIKIGHITVKYGDVVAKDEDTTVSNEDSYVLPVTVTGPLTVTVSMKATVTVSAGSGTIPESIAFTINGIEEADKTATLIVGTPCSVDFTGTDEATVFDGWTASGWQTYTSGTPPAMVPKYAQSSTRPYTFTLVGNTVFVPSFVEADEFPFVAVQFFDATANAVFVQGGSNPTATQTGGTPTTRAAMRAQIGGLSEGNFDDAFADNASVMYLSLASLASLELTAAGTASLPFLRFEKAAITKGNGTDTDCTIGEWSAISPVINPATFSVVVSCAYRAVFGAYQPQKNTAAFQTSAMRSMGSVTVSGYDTTTASDGSVSAYTGYGDTVTWAAAPNIGYTFEGWYSLAGETYTLVSSLNEYSIEQDTVARTLYAAFGQDTTRLYLMEGAATRKTALWQSKRFELQRPTAFSACRADADGYPIQLQAHSFSSPSMSDATDTGVVICADQDARRIPSMRKERFFEFSVETVHPVVGMSFSTTMQGLS